MSLDVPEAPPGLASGLGVVHASKRPLIARGACDSIIAAADVAAAARGWTTDRHVHAPTCDLPVYALAPDAVL